LGRWENIRQEGDKWLADPVFDSKDPEAAEIKRKYEEGFLHAASIQIDIKETTTQNLVQGQTRPSISKCEVLEVSIVGIPGNPNAVKYGHGNDIDKVLPLIANEAQKQEMVDLVLELGQLKGIVNEENKAEWSALALADSKTVRKLFAKVPNEPKPQQQQRFSTQLQAPVQEAKQDRKDWDFLKWSKEDPQGLLRLKREEPEQYQILANNYK
jgi:hypothetical protein